MQLILRDYQTDIINQTREALRQGKTAPLICLPCGSGKTVVFAWLANEMQKKNKSVWFMVHRQELYDQTVETFNRFDIPLTKITIGMIQTVARNLEKYPVPEIIIFDECFPSNTMITTPNGKKLLTEIKINDMIATYNHHERLIEYKPVFALSKKIPYDIVKITLANGKTITCTPNHPIYDVNKGDYVNAENLTNKSAILRTMQKSISTKRCFQSKKQRILPIKQSIISLFKRMCKDLFSKQKPRNISLRCMQKTNILGEYDKTSTLQIQKNKREKSLLFGAMFGKCNPRSTMQKKQNESRGKIKNIGKNENPKSNGFGRKQNKNVKTIERNRSLPKKSAWKWLWFDNSTTRNDGCIKRIRSLCRIPNINRIRERKRNLPELLQGRYSNTRKNDSNRDRRWFTRNDLKTNRGQEKNRIFKFIGVESVEIQKQTGDGTFGGLCPDGYVYNLEVKGNHNYFANDVLVHNCHFSAANTWSKIIKAFPKALRIGLTATPERLDGKPLGNIYDCLIEGVSTQNLIDSEKLANYQYFGPSVVDLTSLKKKLGDYNQTEAADLLSTDIIIGDIVKNYKKYANGKKTICYCPTVEFSQKMAKIFQSAGLPSVHFDGNTPAAERKQIIKDFRAGIIQILCNVDLISVGFDVPDCECCILLRPTQSTALFIQQSMRALRPLPGKTAIILDHVGNYTRHGLPADDRDWSLVEKVKKPKTANNPLLTVRQCPQCFYTYKSTETECPNCGFVKERSKAEIKIIKELKLEEIKKYTVIPNDWKKCKSRLQLKLYAESRGYKKGWVFYKAKELHL